MQNSTTAEVMPQGPGAANLRKPQISVDKEPMLRGLGASLAHDSSKPIPGEITLIGDISLLSSDRALSQDQNAAVRYNFQEFEEILGNPSDCLAPSVAPKVRLQILDEGDNYPIEGIRVEGGPYLAWKGSML